MLDVFYRNRRLLVLAVALIVVAGTSAFRSLPRLEDPELVARNALVTTRVPGADAERVESLVTERIEDELFDVEEIKTVESISRAGVSIVQIELKDEIVDTDTVWSRVRDQLGDVRPELPTESLDPQFDEIDVRGYAMIAALTWNKSEPANYALLRRLAESLEDRFRAIRGTENVDIFGEPSEEITVEVDHARLVSMGLTVDDVANQIRRSDSKVSAGTLHNAVAGDILVEVEGEMESLDRVRRTPIHYGQEGQFVELSDIAVISKGIRHPATDLAIVAGVPAVTVAAFVDSSERIDLWARDARADVQAFSEELPRGIALEVVFDQSHYTERRLDGLLTNLSLGAAAVVVVMLFMMGWRSALIVSLSLPLSSLMVVAGMNLLDIPLHQMSVTGLIIALGLLIDNAIVMVDEVRERLRHGKQPVDAIAASVRHLAIPLLGSTLTTALAFAPIALMPGSVGEFVGTIAVSVILAMGSSLFLAMTIIPAVTGMAGRGHREESRWWERGLSGQWMTSLFSRSLLSVLRRPALGLAIGMALPIAGFIMATDLIEQFFPPTGRDMFQIEIELPAHASMDQTAATARRAREQIIDHPRVHDVHWFLGNSAPSFYYNLVADQKNASFYAQGIVRIDSSEHTSSLINALQRELDVAFPDVRVLVRQLEQGPPIDAPIELRLYGPNVDRLRDLGDDARTILSSLPDVVHTDADLSETLPKLSVVVDEQKARLAGLDLGAIAAQLDRALEGNVGGSVVESTEELPIRVRTGRQERGDLAQIESLDLLSASSTGQFDRTVPLASLGAFELIPERAAIAHRNGRRVNVVRGYLAAGVLPGKVLAEFKASLEQSLPSGYSMEFGGEAAERDAAVRKLAGSMGVLVTLMIATLVMSFGSFRMASIIGSVALLSGGLGLGSLWVFGYPFGFMAIVGTMGLIGIAINDSIVVLAALREDAGASSGDVVAARDVVVRSSRHVVATTVTTIAGFIPLIVEGGGFWPPLAITIAGGVTGATVLALVFVPSAFRLLGTALHPSNASDVETAKKTVAFGPTELVLGPFPSLQTGR